jgi:hypothetical protein
MALSPRALLAFGEMVRNGGVAGEAQVVPAGWIAESWTPRTRSVHSGEQYGLGWFIASMGGHPVYYAWGFGGQMLYIVPDLAPDRGADLRHRHALRPNRLCRRVASIAGRDHHPRRRNGLRLTASPPLPRQQGALLHRGTDATCGAQETGPHDHATRPHPQLSPSSPISITASRRSPTA